MAVNLIGRNGPFHKGSNDPMNRVISNLAGVKAAVYKEAEVIGEKAQAILDSHRYPKDDTQAEIEVAQADVDSYVSLVDPACLSIEFGHRDAKTGKHVAGLYILHRAGGLL